LKLNLPRQNALQYSVLVTMLLLICLIGWWGTAQTDLQGFKQRLQTKTLPKAMLDHGTKGEILKLLDLVYIAENHTFPTPDQLASKQDLQFQILNAFRKKRRPGIYAYQANTGGAQSLPSSDIPFDNEPTLRISLAFSTTALQHPDVGLLSQPLLSQTANAQSATMTLFRNGEIIYASSVGAKIIGPNSFRKRQQPGNYQGFRLLFRSRFGSDPAFATDFLESTSSHKLHSLIVDPVNPRKKYLALQLARQAGLKVPDHQLANLSLNGQDLGLRLLRESVSSSQWAKRLEHEDFEFYRYGDLATAAEELAYNKAVNWTDRNRHKIDRKMASKLIDVENLTHSIIYFLYCGSSDWFNWAMVRNFQGAVRWQWVVWNLDSCFSDRWLTGNGLRWQQNWIENAVYLRASDHRWQAIHDDLRLSLFAALMNNDPEYPNYFFAEFQRLLKNVYSSDKLMPQIRVLKRISGSDRDLATGHRNLTMSEIEQFLRNRGDFLISRIKSVQTNFPSSE
jgi:hypothetical protein